MVRRVENPTLQSRDVQGGARYPLVSLVSRPSVNLLPG